MKREIEIRKKRFAAFWLGIVLICCLVIPITANAAEHSVGESLAGTTVYAGDTLTYSDTNDAYSIYYIDYDGETLLGNYDSDDNNEHTVLDYSSLATLPEGLEFAGWSVESVYVSSGSQGSVTLHALTSYKTYSITYELNGGTNGDNPVAYTYGTGVASLADAVKEGHTFDGWYTDPDFTNKVESIGTAQTGDITLYAKFSFDPNAIGKGTFELKAGKAYKLSNGVQLSGDSSVYGDGITFYVPQDGSYTFE